MPDFSKRSKEMEIMDDLGSSGKIIDQTLRELEFINTWLGGNAVTLNALSRVKRRKGLSGRIRIADLGCGGGDMLKLVNGWSQKNNVSTELLGVDANPNIVAYARKNVPLENVSFKATDIFSNDFKLMEFDIVMATLFFHHFTDVQLIEFFNQLKQQVKTAVIINDIHRHPLAFYSIKWLTQGFSKSPMVIHDAPVSVLRAFARNELHNIIRSAGFTDYTLEWKWAFRWQAVLYV
jgi:SAM-dependent methyltransferase